jgi:hypothetical protein
MPHWFVSFLLVVGLLGGQNSFLSTKQQGTIEFRNVKVESSYPDGITFRIEICGRPKSSDVAFYYTTSADATQYWGWTKEIWSLDEGQTSDNCDKRKFYLETKEFEIPPFSPIRYYWAVDHEEKTSQSPHYVYYYRDAAYDWKSMEDPNFVIWWHDRPDSFGQEVMSIASKANEDQAAFYSMTLSAPVIIVIANSSEEFFAWQTEENYAGGIAFPDINLTIQLVEGTMGHDDWLGDVIPHEISHIYFYNLAKRYSGAPHWLDEGLATYQEYNDHLYEWDVMRDAYASDHLLSLKDLEYDFGEDEDSIDIAYAESYYAVLYMDEFYGRASISTLLAEFGKGTGETAAFQSAFGKTPEDFESDFTVWLAKRVETAPPDTKLQKSLSAEESNRLYFLLTALCSLPLCFVAFGAGIIAILWKLNNKISEGKNQTVNP